MSRTDKYQNKYRIQSSRLQNWDYGWNAVYFITICTNNRECYFGEIVDGKMKLSNIGEIANVFWYEIPSHFQFVKLDAFVVMPNHIHGILILNNENGNNGVNVIINVNVETRHALSLQPKIKKQLVNNDFKIRAKIPFHQLLVHINLPFQNIYIV